MAVFFFEAAFLAVFFEGVRFREVDEARRAAVFLAVLVAARFAVFLVERLLGTTGVFASLGVNLDSVALLHEKGHLNHKPCF